MLELLDTKPIAPTARQIVDARKRGMRPAQMVILSQVGPLPSLQNPVVLADHIDYDWGWVNGLEICIYTDNTKPWLLLLDRVLREHPSKSLVWDVFLRRGRYGYLLPPKNAATGEFDWFARIPDVEEWTDFQNSAFEQPIYW